MNIILFFFLGLLFSFLAAPVYAGPMAASLAPDLQYVLVALLKSPLLFLLILVGLIFQRRFLLKWNFIILFIFTFVLPMVLSIPVLIMSISDAGLFEVFSFFVPVLLIPALLLSAGFSIPAFVISDIFWRVDRIQTIQEVFYRRSEKFRAFMLLLLYLIWIPSILLYFINNEFFYLSLGVSIVLSALFLVVTYKKAKSLLPTTLTFDRKDYKYFAGMLLVFMITFIWSYFVVVYKGVGDPF